MTDKPAPRSRSDSMDTIRPSERPRTPSPERARRIAEESARLEKITQRSRDLQDAKSEFPNALEGYQWENYNQTLEKLKTTDPTSRDSRKLEEILGHYDRRIEAEKVIKKMEAETKRLEKETFDSLMDSFPSSSSGSSDNESGAEDLKNRR